MLIWKINTTDFRIRFDESDFKLVEKITSITGENEVEVIQEILESTLRLARTMYEAYVG